jgi:PIN domain nuclease of toxin-antitoxin system
LSEEARQAIALRENDVFPSAVSLLEAALKEAAGRLDAPTPVLTEGEDAGFIELPVRWRHALHAAALLPLHRDPFDRMLLAQALEESLVIAPRDPVLTQYPVATMAA